MQLIGRVYDFVDFFASQAGWNWNGNFSHFSTSSSLIAITCSISIASANGHHISTRCASFHISFQWQQQKRSAEWNFEVKNNYKWKFLSFIRKHLGPSAVLRAYMKIREINFQWNVKERKRCARGNFSLKSPFLRQRWLVRVEWLTIDFSRATCCVSSVGRSSSDGQHIPTYTHRYRHSTTGQSSQIPQRFSLDVSLFSVLLKTPGKSIHMNIAEESEEEKRNKKKYGKVYLRSLVQFFFAMSVCWLGLNRRIYVVSLDRPIPTKYIYKSYIDTQYWWQLAIQDDDKIALFTSIVSFHRDIDILRHTRAFLDEIWQKCISTLRRMPKKASIPCKLLSILLQLT